MAIAIAAAAVFLVSTAGEDAPQAAAIAGGCNGLRLHVVPVGTPAHLAAVHEDRPGDGCQADPTAPFSTPDQV